MYGFVLAFIPGIGLDIVSNTAYEIQKKINKKLNLMKTQENNLIASETANNSGAFSILLPFLAFGIPTSTSQVLLFNILNDKGFLFGPLSFNNNLINKGVLWNWWPTWCAGWVDKQDRYRTQLCA